MLEKKLNNWAKNVATSYNHVNVSKLSLTLCTHFILNIENLSYVQIPHLKIKSTKQLF